VFHRNEEKLLRKKFKKRKILLDFFLWAFHTYKKFSLEKRGKRELSIYTHIYIYKRERGGKQFQR